MDEQEEREASRGFGGLVVVAALALSIVLYQVFAFWAATP